MSFTPNQPNAVLTGRVQQQQQQQVHQAPVTTVPGSSPQSTNMQKNPNLSNTFPVNQQSANMPQKANDDKNQMQPSSVHQQSSQNNNNHGMGGNIQPYQQSQPHISMPSLVQGGGQKVGNIFHQIQQMQGYQSQQFHQTTAATQPQHVGPVHHGGMTSQQHLFQKLPPNIPQPIHNIQTVKTTAANQPQHIGPVHHGGVPSQQQLFQKLPPTIPQPVHTVKTTPAPQNLQQQVKPISNQLSPSVSQANTQYIKPNHPHPQMKTTAKLVSPGSQLQSLQKSPTAPNPPQGVQQVSPQNKIVPSTSPAASPPSNTTTSHNTGGMKGTTVTTSPANQTSSSVNLIPSSQAQVPVMKASAPAPVVPSQSVTNTVLLPVKATASAPVTTPVEQPLTKTVDQSKEAAASPSKPVPKPAVDKTSPSTTPTVATPVQETNNKVEKSPAVKVEKPVAIVEKQPAVAAPAVKPAAPALSPSKSTMRLATVTPARQKKPPATNNKKPTTPVAAAVVPKSPVKVVTSPAKPVEAPKTPSTKKAQTPAPVVVTPKSAVQPASSPQPTSSTASGSATTPKTKRSRVKAQPYQCPTPELALVTKLSTQAANSNSKKRNDDKLTIFYKNEFLAVRNSEGGFYLCQAMQNVYKSSPKIHIRWLDEKEKEADASSDAKNYTVAFFDTTDFECVLTTVELEKVEVKTYELPKSEQTRIESILKKAIDVEKGIAPRPAVTEENPDGLDLSLYKDEAQLDKASPNKRKRDIKSDDGDDDADEDYEESPRKKKVIKREPAVKTPRTKKAVLVNDDSTESDEENLMEIKKKANKQAAATTPKTPAAKKAPEPTPSTSKASATPARGRKRGGAAVEPEVPAKVANVEKVEAVKESPKAKAQAAKKSVTPKTSPAVEKKPAPEPRPVAEKRPAAKKALPVEDTKAQAPVAPSPKVVENKTPAKANPKKKPPPKAKASPAAAPVVASTSDQQPSTSRSRNTRSKK